MSLVERYLPCQQPVIESLGYTWSMDELVNAMNAMKFSKSCGVDKTPIEFHVLINSAVYQEKVLAIFNAGLCSGKIESLLKDVIIVFLHKKGSKLDCDNYRTLSLISHMGKVLERMILNRLNVIAESKNWLPESQNGFRNGRSTIDSLFCSRLVSSYCREKCTATYYTFIDLTKAYDKVDRSILWVLLERLGVPSSFVNQIKAIHEGSKAVVRNGKCFSDSFLLNVGLKQGSVFAPILFNIFFGAIINAVNSEMDPTDGVSLKYRIGNDCLNDPMLGKGHRVYTASVQELLFADDNASVSCTASGLQKKLDIFVMVSSAFGQELSIKKTNVLLVQPRIRKGESLIEQPNIKVHTSILETVSKFKYVGSYQNSTGDADDEVGARIQRMLSAYRVLKVKNRRLSLECRLKGFITFVMSAGLYGCECWNATQAQIKRLEGCQYNLLCRILRYHWTLRKSFADVIDDCRQLGIDMLPFECIIRRTRLTYFGHVLRMSDSRLPKIMLFGAYADGKGMPGRECSYKVVIKEDLKLFGIGDDFNVWYPLATLDRGAWRYSVKTAGVEVFMGKWYADRASKSTHRHIKANPDASIVASKEFRYIGRE